MKAVIVDVKGSEAVVLSKNGEFLKIRNSGKFNIGHEIDLPERKSIYTGNIMRTAASIAAVFILTIGMGYGVYSYYDPYGYINIDINPSVEIVVNKYNRTLSVQAVNDDGEKVLGDQNFKNKPASLVVEDIIRNAAKNGYMNEDKSNAVMLTVSTNDEKKAEEIEAGIQEAAKKELAVTGKEAEVLVEHVTVERHDQAKKMDISPGKLLLIEKLQSIDPQVKIEDVKNASVKDIITELKDKDDKRQKEEKASRGSQKTEETGDKRQDKPSDKKESKINISKMNKVENINEKREQDEDKNKGNRTSEKESKKFYEDEDNSELRYKKENYKKEDYKEDYRKEDKNGKDSEDKDRRNTNDGQKQKEKNKNGEDKNSGDKNKKNGDRR